MKLKTQEDLQLERHAFNNGYWAGVISTMSAIGMAAFISLWYYVIRD